MYRSTSEYDVILRKYIENENFTNNINLIV